MSRHTRVEINLSSKPITSISAALWVNLRVATKNSGNLNKVLQDSAHE